MKLTTYVARSNLHIEETIRVSATFAFVYRVNCVHRLILPDLHLSVFGTETFSSDKRLIDISDTRERSG